MSGYRPQASDTSEAVDRLVFEGFARMTPTERLALCARACRDLRHLTIAGLPCASRTPAKTSSRGAQARSRSAAS